MRLLGRRVLQSADGGDQPGATHSHARGHRDAYPHTNANIYANGHARGDTHPCTKANPYPKPYAEACFRRSKAVHDRGLLKGDHGGQQAGPTNMSLPLRDKPRLCLIFV